MGIFNEYTYDEEKGDKRLHWKQNPLSDLDKRSQIFAHDGEVHETHNVYETEEGTKSKVGENCSLATLPELLAARTHVDNKHPIATKRFLSNTKEHAGIDTYGVFGAAGDPVLVVLHGGGMVDFGNDLAHWVDYDRTRMNYFNQEAFDNLLTGSLRDGSTVPMYPANWDVHSERRFGVVLPLEQVVQTPQGLQQHDVFCKNPLVRARAGGTFHLSSYYYRACNEYGGVFNWRSGRYNDIPTKPITNIITFENHTMLGWDSGVCWYASLGVDLGK